MPRKQTLKRRPVEINDLARIKFVRAPVLSPDELSVCFAVETMSEDRKKYVSHLWRCNADGLDLRQLTFGDRSDSSPLFSPDGRWIAFVSKRGDLPGIHLLPTSGGESHPLTEMDGSFAWLTFTPDSRTVICGFRQNDPLPNSKTGDKKASSREESAPKSKRESPVCRHVDRLFYRLDGEGYLPQDGYHLWAFDIESGKGRQLTRGRFNETNPTVSPDGKWIAFVSNHRPDPDRDPMRQDLFLVRVTGGPIRRVPTPPGPVELPSFSPDGRLIAYYGHTDPDAAWGSSPMHVWVVGTSGRPAARDLTPNFDRETSDVTLSDTGEGHGSILPQWSPDGRSLTVMISDAGATYLSRLPKRGGNPEPLFQTKQHVQSAAFGKVGRHAALLLADATHPAEVAVVDLRRHSTPTTITALNEKWLREVAIGKPHEVWFGSTGKTRVQGWVLKPPTFRPGRRYPGIVEIHGGPRAQYGYSFFHEMQLLAARGYVVFYCNPRGSQGRGRAFTTAITNAWGTVDYEDVMAGTDWLCAQPYIDSKRVGVTGGSYGGYMTNWIVGHTNRFKAAVTQRSVVSLKSFYGTSDTGWDWEREFGGPPWKNPSGYERMSPLTYAKNVRTPLLILHNESDYRCLIEQAEQWYTTLRVMGKRVELVRFPEEPHGLSRHGRPDRRFARLEHMLRWFDRYLLKR